MHDVLSVAERNAATVRTMCERERVRDADTWLPLGTSAAEGRVVELTTTFDLPGIEGA